MGSARGGCRWWVPLAVVHRTRPTYPHRRIEVWFALIRCKVRRLVVAPHVEAHRPRRVRWAVAKGKRARGHCLVTVQPEGLALVLGPALDELDLQVGSRGSKVEMTTGLDIGTENVVRSTCSVK